MTFVMANQLHLRVLKITVWRVCERSRAQMASGAIVSQVVKVSFICCLSVLTFFFSFSITKTIAGHQISDSDFIGLHNLQNL